MENTKYKKQKLSNILSLWYLILYFNLGGKPPFSLLQVMARVNIIMLCRAEKHSQKWEHAGNWSCFELQVHLLKITFYLIFTSTFYLMYIGNHLISSKESLVIFPYRNRKFNKVGQEKMFSKYFYNYCKGWLWADNI